MPSKLKNSIDAEQQRLAKAARKAERKVKREAKREAAIEAARTADKLYLMKEISKRLGLLGLNSPTDSENTDGWSEIERAYKAILDQLCMASEIGMDVRGAFDIDHKAISEKAKHLAARWSRRDDLIFDLPWTQRRPSDQCRFIQRWFTKLLLRRERQVTDYLHHIAQRIGKFETPIVSDMVLFSKQEQRKLAQDFGERNVFKTTIQGRTVTVPFNDAASTAYKRASKLYVRALGFEKYFSYLGYCGLFVTISLPPEFHPNPSIGDFSWDGSTPLHGHESLQRKWRVFKGIYAKSHGPMIFLRVEEPHSDACTHWHILAAVEPCKQEKFEDLLAEHFGGEPATKIAAIDPDKATAASYMMKYLLKATRADKNAEAARYEAHRATWGMRSVVFFDHPGSSTLWDEFRRIKPNSAQHLALKADATNANLANQLAEATSELQGVRSQVQILQNEHSALNQKFHQSQLATQEAVVIAKQADRVAAELRGRLDALLERSKDVQAKETASAVNQANQAVAEPPDRLGTLQDPPKSALPILSTHNAVAETA